jgi:predicted Na+-dependent transporter
LSRSRRIATRWPSSAWWRWRACCPCGGQASSALALVTKLVIALLFFLHGGALFPSASVGLVVLPAMLFHQLQLMACAVIAQQYAARAKVS